jgi:hypothetical protein
MSKNWTLMATHGVVLFYIAGNPDSTMRQMSDSLAVTERRISQIVRDLSDAKLIEVKRCGRRNTYTVNRDSHFLHPYIAHVPLARVVQALAVDDYAG